MDWGARYRLVTEDPGKIVSYLIGISCLLMRRADRRFHLGKGIKVYGRPILDVRGKCTISIGDNVTIDSRNVGYFGSMFGPVKLFADIDGASISIGANTFIHGSCLHAYNRIDIGENCLIAANTQIVDSDGHDPFPSRPEDRLKVKPTGIPIVIEDNVWIGMNCIILKGVHVGTGAVVGAGSVVRHDVPAYCLASGNPATVIKRVDRGSSAERKANPLSSS